MRSYLCIFVVGTGTSMVSHSIKFINLYFNASSTKKRLEFTRTRRELFF